MIKVFVSDLDKTLLDSDHELPNETRSLIKMMRANGLLFGIATGRPRGSVLATIPDIIDLVDFAIFENGGLVEDYINKTSVEQFPLDKDTVIEIIELGRSVGGNPTITNEGMMYTDDNTRFVSYGNKVLSNIVEGDVMESLLDHHPKVIFNGSEDVLEAIAQKAHAQKSTKYRAFKSAADLIEFMDPRVNKFMGIQLILDQYGLSAENLMTFGDNDNDVEMVDGAKLGVAVKNATDAVKAVADIEIESNELNGVYRFLSRYLEQ